MKASRKTGIRIVALMVVVTALALPLAAEERIPPFERFPRALGAMFGEVTGTGLHYHRWFGPNGLGITGGIIYQPLGAEMPWLVENTLDYNVGVAYHRRVYGDEFGTGLAGSLYLVAGGGHRGYIPVIRTYDPIVEEPVPNGEYAGDYQAALNLGIGVGIEIILLNHISVPAEFLYGAVFTPTASDTTEWLRIAPTGQIGLRYRY